MEESLESPQECSKCHEVKLATAFRYSYKDQKKTRRSECWDCEKEWRKNRGFAEGTPANLTATFRHLHVHSKKRAGKKNLEYTISAPFIRELYLKQEGKCIASGEPLKLRSRRGTGNPHAEAISVDRIDNSKGYTPDNVQLVTWFVNRMRGGNSLEETYAYAKKFVTYWEATHNLAGKP
jgi:hypothetical protein